MTETTGTSTPKTRGKTAKPATRKPQAAKQASNVIAIAPAARETPEKKPVATPAKAVRKKTKSTSISTEDRQRLIAEAAYLRAEQRNFVGGDPVADWLEAEADVNARLTGSTH